MTCSTLGTLLRLPALRTPVGTRATGRLAKTDKVDARVLAERLEGAPWLVACDIEDATLRLTVSDAQRAAHDLPRAVAESSLGLLRLASEEVSLEDVFVQLVGGERA